MACPHCGKEPDYEFEDDEKKEADYGGDEESFNVPPFIPADAASFGIESDRVAEIKHDFSDMLPAYISHRDKMDASNNLFYRTLSHIPKGSHDDSIVSLGPVS